MSYTEFKYLWPPRPEQAVMPGFFGMYEKRGWTAQVKKNGTCSIIAVDPNHKLTTMTRYNDQHKMWAPSEKSSAAFKMLPAKWFVFVAEIMHNKTPELKDTVYVHDILVHEGEELNGMTFGDRQKLLHSLWKIESDEYSHHVVTPNHWVARNVTSGFVAFYNSLTLNQDEGLVIKDTNAKLNPCYKHDSNKAWQVKCRKRTKNYGF